MKLLRPDDGLMRKKSPDKVGICRIWVYQRLLKHLSKSYFHYAKSDVIVLEFEDIKIVHEYRDREFETELRRNKIDFQLKPQNVPFPFFYAGIRQKSHFTYFNFKDSLVLHVGSRSVTVLHEDVISVDGSLKCRVRGSEQMCGLTELAVEVTSSGRQKLKKDKFLELTSSGMERQPDSGKKTSARKMGIFAKETPVSVVDIPVVETEQEDIPALIEKRGFEIDSSF